MKLKDYPRPTQDTGVGMHGPPDWQDHFERQQWVMERLWQMGIRWYEMLIGNDEPVTHGDIKALVDFGFAVMARIMPTDEWTDIGKCFTVGEIDCTVSEELVRGLIGEGCHYIRLGNEADLPIEWNNENLVKSYYPDRLMELVDEVIDFDLRNGAIVRRLGGIYVLTDMGLKVDHNHLVTYPMLYAHAAARGVLQELFAPPVAISIHNRPLNRPAEYPHDRDETWRDWPHPQAEWTNDRAYCYNAIEMFLAILASFRIAPVPIFATEQGYEITWKQDPRYPEVADPQDHAAKNVALLRYMQKRRRPAEFAQFMWHLHRRDGAFANEAFFENQIYNLQEMPIVQAMIDAKFPAIRDQIFAGEQPAPTDEILIWPELRHQEVWYPLRPLEQIEWIVIHHDAGIPPSDSVDAERRYIQNLNEYFLVGRGWPGFGYYALIMPSGRVWITSPADRATYHVGVKDTAAGAIIGLDENGIALGIAFAGSYTHGLPTTEALRAAKKVISDWKAGLPSFRAVLGHREIPGAATECPGRPIMEWIDREFGLADSTEDIRAALLETARHIHSIAEIQINGVPLLDWAKGRE